MLYYDRIDIFERANVNKTGESKECNICHYWYFLEEEFKFQPDVCSGCNDVLVTSMNLSNIAILNIQGDDSRSIISGVTKSEAINVIQNIDLTEKNVIL